jgi:hypothetical protein
VIQHDVEEDEAHRPVRRRPRTAAEQAASTPSALQLVETQAAAPAPANAEDDLPRRTRPRRRRGGSQANEPLMLVETQGEDKHVDPPAAQ